VDLTEVKQEPKEPVRPTVINTGPRFSGPQHIKQETGVKVNNSIYNTFIKQEPGVKPNNGPQLYKYIEPDLSKVKEPERPLPRRSARCLTVYNYNQIPAVQQVHFLISIILLGKYL
jgi:hypothetical protein